MAGGLIRALEPTSNPIGTVEGLGGMEQRNFSVSLHGQQRVETCQTAWEFLLEAMPGHPVEEQMHAAGSVERAWKAVMAWCQPQSDAKMDHLENEFENIAMQGDQDSKIIFSRAEGKLNVFFALNIRKSDREVVFILTRRLLQEVFDVEQRTSSLRPGITRLEG